MIHFTLRCNHLRLLCTWHVSMIVPSLDLNEAKTWIEATTLYIPIFESFNQRCNPLRLLWLQSKLSDGLQDIKDIIPRNQIYQVLTLHVLMFGHNLNCSMISIMHNCLKVLRTMVLLMRWASGMKREGPLISWSSKT